MQVSTFDDAAISVREGTFEVSNKTKLLFYGLYKVAMGEKLPDKPRANNPMEKAKWDAWKNQSDLSKSEARQAYIMLVNTALGAK